MKNQGLEISREDLDLYIMLEPLLRSVLTELRSFSSKKQDGVLSVAKVGMINKILTPLKSLLIDESVVEFLEILDSDSLPSNSDAVIVVVQYEAALSGYKTKRTYSNGTGGRNWRVIKPEEEETN